MTHSIQSPVCEVCNRTPSLYVVGKRFFCKLHQAEAIQAARSTGNDSRAHGRPEFKTEAA